MVHPPLGSCTESASETDTDDRCTIYDTDGSVLADIVPTVRSMRLNLAEPLDCIKFSSTVCRSGILENASEKDLDFLTEALFSLGLAVPRDMAKKKSERMGNLLKSHCRDKLQDATSATYKTTQRILRLYRTASERKLNIQKLFDDDIQTLDKQMEAQDNKLLVKEWTDTVTSAIGIKDEPEE
jgi:hypothetical protein